MTKKAMMGILKWGLSLVLVIALFFVSCDKDDEIIYLDYWTHDDSSRNNLEEELIAEFENLYPHIRVNRKTFSSSEILNIVPTAFEASKAPDIFTMQQDYLSTLLDRNYVSEIDISSLGYDDYKSLEDEYIESSFKPVSRNGVIYGIPMELTNWCLYINKNLFREVGLDPETDYPRTWEDMVDICTRMVERENGILVKRGFDFRYPYYMTFFIPMVQQLGGDIVNENGDLSLINEDAWVDAFSFMQQWGPQGLNLGSPTYINARSIFNSEDIAMMLSGLYQEERIRCENPDFYESGDFIVVPFPYFENGMKVPSGRYFHYWCVNDSSTEEEKAASWRFIGFLSSNAMEYLEKVRLLPPKKEVIENIENLSIPYIDVFISELMDAPDVYTGPAADKIASTIEGLMKEVMLSGLDPQKAVIRLKVFLSELNL